VGCVRVQENAEHFCSSSGVAHQRPMTEHRYSMKHPAEIKYEHYRQLFLNARADRSQARGSLAVPVAAAAFVVFNLGTLAQNFDASRAMEPVGLAIGLLATTAVSVLLGAVYCPIRAEWHFVHCEPPDLPGIVRMEEQMRLAHQECDDDRLESSMGRQLQAVLTGSYYVGYEAYVVGNLGTARYRTWALRLVLIALACLAVALLLLPFHLSSGGSPSS